MWNADIFRSAGFQPAVSPVSNRQTAANLDAFEFAKPCGLEIRDTAGWKPALRAAVDAE
jgi:hypothetical protein